VMALLVCVVIIRSCIKMFETLILSCSNRKYFNSLMRRSRLTNELPCSRVLLRGRCAGTPTQRRSIKRAVLPLPLSLLATLT